MKNKKIKILVIGQTPPPYLGQAMMINRLVKAHLDSIKVYHVRMAFSNTGAEIGRFGWYKLLHLFEIIFKAIYYKYRYKISILYYPPSGPLLTPILRDMVLLFFIRPFFKVTVFHFRASGISQFITEQARWKRPIFKKVYLEPDLSIHLSDLYSFDGAFFNSKNNIVVPNGIEDQYIYQHKFDNLSPNSKVKVLCVGLITEKKGILYLLESLKIIVERGIQNIELNIIGGFHTQQFKDKVMEFIKSHSLGNYVNFPGEKIDNEKWEHFYESDIYCFPTCHEGESFGNTVIEAMMFSLPVVATNWRALPGIVDHNQTGLLVPVKDSKSLAEAITSLINNEQLRIEMGKKGRVKFEQCYTLDKHLQKMEDALLKVALSKV